MSRIYRKSTTDQNLAYGKNVVGKGLVISEAGNLLIKRDTNNREDVQLVGQTYTPYVSTTFPTTVVSLTTIQPRYALNEAVVVKVLNRSAYQAANASGDLIFTWTSSDGETVVGDMLQTTATNTPMLWSVVPSSSAGTGTTRTFTITSDATTPPVPVYTQFTGDVNSTHTFRLINSDAYSASTTFNWRVLNGAALADTPAEDYEVLFPNVYGITHVEVRAVDGSKMSGWQTIPVVTAPDAPVLDAVGATFRVIDPITLNTLANHPGTGQRAYVIIEINNSVPGPENLVVEMLSITNAKMDDSDTAYIEGVFARNPPDATYNHGALLSYVVDTDAVDTDIVYHYIIRQKYNDGGIRCTTRVRVFNNPLYQFTLSWASVYLVGDTDVLTMTDEQCLPKGYYSYTIDSASIAALGLSGNSSTRRVMGEPLAITVAGGSTSRNITFTIKDAVNSIVKTWVVPYTVTSGLNTLVYIGSPSSSDIGTTFSYTKSGYIDYEIQPDPGPMFGNVVNPENLIVYDIEDVNAPIQMSNRLSLTERLNGSRESGVEYFTASDTASWLTNGFDTTQDLSDFTRFNVEIEMSGSQAMFMNTSIRENGFTVNMEYEHLINNVVHDGYTTTTSGAYTALDPILNAITWTAGTWTAWVGGPSGRMLVISRFQTAALSRGKLVIDYGSVGSLKRLEVDADDVTEQKVVRIPVPALSTVKVLSLPMLSDVTLTQST